MLEEKAVLDYNTKFTASSGWFKRSKNRSTLYNVKLSGTSASVDVKAAKEFLETVDELIVEKN